VANSDLSLSNPVIGLIFGLGIVFVVTLLVALIIVKTRKIKKYQRSIILGCIFLTYGLSGILWGDVKLFLLFSLTGAFLIIDGIFMNRGYHNKTYYLLSLVIWVIFGLAVVYIAILTPNSGDRSFLYFLIGLVALGVILLIRSYLRRYKNLKMPWKRNGDELDD
jgi:hypothetical protein